MVDVEIAEVVDEVDVDEVEEASRWSWAVGEVEGASWVRMLDVERVDRVGRLGLEPGAFNPESSSWALLKVLRMVGEVAERVSNRRLVVFLPKAGGSIVVFSDSLGRFDGDGALASNGG